MKKNIPFFFFLAFVLTSFNLQAETTPVRVISDRQYYPTVLKEIEKAKESVNLAIFQIRYYSEYPQSPSNLLIESLIAAAARGVDVEVCLEQSKGYNQENSLENLKVAYKLAAGKVKVYLDDPKKTLHAKFLVIDRHLIILGSTNWSYYSLDKNREMNVLVDSSETARQILGYFEEIKKNSKLFKP